MFAESEVVTGLLAGLGLGAVLLAVPAFFAPRQAARALPPHAAEVAVQRAAGDALTLSALGVMAAVAASLIARNAPVRAGRTAALAVGAAVPLSGLAFVGSGLLHGNAIAFSG